MSVKYLPNILSSVRLCMVPLFVFLFLEGNIIPAVIVFILAGATDVLDGYIARHFNCTSTLGKVLDPLADKFLQLSAFLCLWYRDYIPFWMPLIYFAKELATAPRCAVYLPKDQVRRQIQLFRKTCDRACVWRGICHFAVFRADRRIRRRPHLHSCRTVFCVFLRRVLRRGPY